ncbi:MAG: hypothetical protein WDW38_009004 [Sanguina aurantia]
MFGRQAESFKASAPVYSFSAATNRDQASKRFLSSAHHNVDHRCMEGSGTFYDLPTCLDRQPSKPSPPQHTFSHEERLRARSTEGPGPGSYQSVDLFTSQPLSAQRSPPKYRFGSTSRGQVPQLFISQAHLGVMRGTQGPPPGSYDPPAAIGPQPSSLRRNGPAFTMPKTDRLKDQLAELSRSLPAVGQYESWTAIGKQALSNCKTSPAYGFGHSDWAKEGHRYLTQGHCQALKGVQSPANFDHQQPSTTTSFGRQQLSRRTSLPAFAFGSSPRLVSKKTTDTPGPGAYE